MLGYRGVGVVEGVWAVSDERRLVGSMRVAYACVLRPYVFYCKDTTRATPLGIYWHLASQKWAKNLCLTNGYSVFYKR